MASTIERFDPKRAAVLEEASYLKRWNTLHKMFGQDSESFRVLFTIETLGLIEHWTEPKPERFQEMLTFQLGGGQFQVHLGSVTKLLEPVWPLEMAKTEVALFSAFSTKYTMKQYFLTYTKLCSTALVQTWWALETLANELAGIIAEQRKALVDSATAMLLSEEVPSLDDKGRPSSRTKYQPIEARLLFIYQFLTGTSIDRDGEVWQGITKLKRARDNYTHRIGKGTSESFQLLDVRTLFEGYHAACTYIADLFEQTPEFAARFVYKYLAFWACRSEAPFIADANEGGLFYLGLQHYQPELIRDLMAPQKSTFAIMS